MTIDTTSPSRPLRPRTAPPRRWPWTDRAGYFDRLKAGVFILLFGPVVIIGGRFLAGTLGPRPLNEVILITGLWTIRLLLLSLLITPLRQSWHQARLITTRRMIGVGAMAYALAHLALYAADQQFDLITVASEIWLRLYLTLGFGAVVILAVLGATSTDGAIKRLGGGRWRLLHRFAYLAMGLGAIHFFMQSKIDVTQASWMAGIFLWAMLYRLLRRVQPDGQIPRAPVLVLLAGAAAGLTAAGEALYYEMFTRIPGWRLFVANWDLGLAPRPAATVLGFGLAIALGALVFKRPTRRG